MTHPINPSIACKNCFWWNRQGGGTTGECRIAPPIMKWMAGYETIPPTQYYGWPTTKSEDWCGEFEFAPLPKKKEEA